MLDIEVIDPTYYTAYNSPEFISFEKKLYLSIEGIGEPYHNEFHTKSNLLLNFAKQFSSLALQKLQISFSVPHLESIWMLEDEDSINGELRTRWSWRLLLRIPLKYQEELTTLFEQHTSSLSNVEDAHIEFFEYADGDCVQMLSKEHASDVTSTPIRELFQYIRQIGRRVKPFHHEIYLNNTHDSKKVIIRQPLI